MKGLPTNPWHRIAAESATIIFSILLAFGIDAWWAERQIQNDVHESLQAIRAELESNLTLVDREASYRQAVIKSIEKLDTNDAESDQLYPEDVDKLLGDLVWVGKSEFSTGALEAALQSELFSNIKDGELRRVLAALPALYEYVWEFEKADSESTTNRLHPYLSANGSLNQIANTTGSGRPGTGEFAFEPNYRLTEIRDHSPLLRRDEFLGMLSTKHWDHLNVLDALQRSLQYLDLSGELLGIGHGFVFEQLDRARFRAFEFWAIE